MKLDTRQLFRDLKAAVTLGKPEAVDIALDGLLELPGVASNEQMSMRFIESVVIPVGTQISSLESPQLRPLLKHPLAVGRALGGISLAYRYARHGDAVPKDLRLPANDARRDVRLAVGQSLYQLGTAHPAAILHLGASWIKEPSARIRYTTLIFLPALANEFEQEIFNLLGSLGMETNQELQIGLVDALQQLAGRGYSKQVLDLLALWSGRPDPDSWVISRVLSNSWAADHGEVVKSILQEVISKTGETSHVSGALRALRRHGLEISL